MDIPKATYLTKCILQVCFVIVTNLYCIPTYLMWMWVIFLPFRILNFSGYWYMEGVLYKWLLCMVASWSWESKYYIKEVGDDISSCIDERCLFLVNHQSTADVPLLMAAFQEKSSVLSSIMWVMDRMFRYTNFGLVSVTHGDYFITQGKNVRSYQMLKLQDHLLNVYLGRSRKWIVLFPEGGFLSKRKETSIKYAKQNNFPVLDHVTLPRVGAMHIILNTLRPGKIKEIIAEKSGLSLAGFDENFEPLKWVIDMTVCYPESSKPLDLLAICSSSRPMCTTYMHYRRYPVAEVPFDSMDSLRDWVYARWVEKEELLKEYYNTGTFPLLPQNRQGYSTSCLHFAPQKTHLVTLSNWWIVFLHLFFISSSLLHYYILHRLWYVIF